ncbi:MAG: aldo/keto reductase [Pseudomonadales bacterium]
MSPTSNDRRDFIKSAALLALAANVPPLMAADTLLPIKKAIPSSGERLAVIGMGTSRTFVNPNDSEFQQQLLEVLNIFFSEGGQLLDSSPMYGPAESIVGQLLPKLDNTGDLFAATKVWTRGEQAGIEQMQDSMRKMSAPVMDLMQIHNLKDWQTHLKTLREWKEQGKIRYLGITTSHGRFHSELIDIMRNEPLDFVQLSYNIMDREAEQVLLPMARDKGIATLINRPYQRGDLFSRSRGKPLPAIAQDLQCTSWGQLFLKWILGHPAANCVIPASSKPKHVRDNMAAGFGALPDAAQRQKILDTFNAL